MTYETIAQVSQIGTLILFTLFFLGVIGYAFWPANKAKFERAARLPLEKDGESHRNGGPA